MDQDQAASGEALDKIFRYVDVRALAAGYASACADGDWGFARELLARIDAWAGGEPGRLPEAVAQAAAELEAAGLVFERPVLDGQGIVRGYTEVRLADGEAGSAARHDIVFTARHVVNVLDRVVGLGPGGHHNGYDSSRCERAGCGRPWWDDEGHHHLVAEVMRELGLL